MILQVLGFGFWVLGIGLKNQKLSAFHEKAIVNRQIRSRIYFFTSNKSQSSRFHPHSFVELPSAFNIISDAFAAVIPRSESDEES